MFKNILKEVIIILLLLLAIVLILGIFLYDYIPTSKIVPTIETYQVPENIKNELEENINENEVQTIVTYEIDQSDLKNYEKGKDYIKGKANPFESYSSQTTNNSSQSNTVNTNKESNKNTTTSNTVANNTTNSNPNSTGNYLPDNGTK